MVALVSPDALPPERCAQACALLGAWSGGAAGLLLALASPSPEWQRSAQIQAGLGLTVLLGAAMSWLWPPVSRAYFVLVGLVLVGVVVWYPFFMVQALTHRHESGTQRFAHAPGALALGFAFGVRLLVDFGIKNEDARRRFARSAGIAGMAIGGALDLLVLQRIISLF